MNKFWYSLQLNDPRWKRKAKEIKERDGCCQCCGSEKYLNAHHVVYIDNLDIWNYPDEYYITLCKTCHKSEHDYQTIIKKKIEQMRLSGLLSHEIDELLFCKAEIKLIKK